MAPSNEEIAAQYQNNAIYVILSSRGALPGFHWGIFIPTASPLGYIWHATNREGGWKLEHKQSNNVPFSMSLVLSQKVGTVTSANFQACRDILNAIRADGTPSPNTGEDFSCRVWVKDALVALHKNRIIVLPKDINDVAADLLAAAEPHKPAVETGKATAEVNN